MLIIVMTLSTIKNDGLRSVVQLWPNLLPAATAFHWTGHPLGPVPGTTGASPPYSPIPPALWLTLAGAAVAWD